MLARYPTSVSDPPKLTIVIATYNERQTLPDLLHDLWVKLPEAQVIVVDDNSPDGTGAWVKSLANQEPRIVLLHREHKQGLGVAAMAGIELALRGRPDWIATMDADLSHDPADLFSMWQRVRDPHAAGVDVLIGSRYVAGGKIENWTRRRRLASWLVNAYARVVLRLNSRDNSSALRIYRTAALRTVDLAGIDNPGYTYLEQILIALQRGGAAIVEHPITFRNRKAGRSKVDRTSLMQNLRDILRLARR